MRHKYEDIDFSTEPWASYLWGAPGQTDLDRDIDHLIEELADDMERPEGTLTIVAHVRSEVDEDDVNRFARLALDELYDRLEDWYGNPDAFSERQSSDDEDKAATVEWVKKIVAGFEVWTCDETDQRVEVDVRKWAAIKAPHWLEESE